MGVLKWEVQWWALWEDTTKAEPDRGSVTAWPLTPGPFTTRAALSLDEPLWCPGLSHPRGDLNSTNLKRPLPTQVMTILESSVRDRPWRSGKKSQKSEEQVPPKIRRKLTSFFQPQWGREEGMIASRTRQGPQRGETHVETCWRHLWKDSGSRLSWPWNGWAPALHRVSGTRPSPAGPGSLTRARGTSKGRAAKTLEKYPWLYCSPRVPALLLLHPPTL